MKVYVLTSRNIERLNWIEQVIPQRETVVVINSLDPDYGAVASKWCKERGIEYHITKSDGTPATGKNSVIKIFLESKDEYMVHVDGDDMLTPHGYKLYKAVAESGKAPDCISLYRQPSIKPPLKNKVRHDFLIECIVNKSLEKDQTRIDYWNTCYPWDKSLIAMGAHNWQNVEGLYNMFRLDPYNAEPVTASRWAEHRVLYNHFMECYSDVSEYMCRMVFFSRKCAELIEYTNHLTIGEDTIQWLQLKKMAMEGKLDMQKRKERFNPSYLAIRDNDSVTLKEGLNNYEWVIPLNNNIKLLKKEGLLPPKYTTLTEFNDGTYL